MASEVKFFDIVTSEEADFGLLSVLEIRTECFTVDWKDIDTGEVEHSEDIHICVVVLANGRVVATAPSNNGDEIADIGDGLALMCKTAWMQANARLN